MAGKGIIASLTDPEILVSEGVPAILGLTSGAVATADQYAALVAATTEAAAIAQLQSSYDALTGYEWGIFNNTSSTSTVSALLSSLGLGQGEAIFPDALVLEMGYQSSRVSAVAPVENGSFMNYNKTANPDQFMIGLSFQGTSSQKNTQLNTLLALRDSVQLVSVRMPSWRRQNMNVVGVNFDRNTRMTADLLIVNVTLQEVRTYATTQILQTNTGTTATTEDQGTMQTGTPSSTQSASIAG